MSLTEQFDAAQTALTELLPDGTAILTDPRKAGGHLANRTAVVILAPPTISYPTTAHALADFEVDLIAPTLDPAAAIGQLAPLLDALAPVIEEARPTTYQLPNGPMFYGYTTKLTDL